MNKSIKDKIIQEYKGGIKETKRLNLRRAFEFKDKKVNPKLVNPQYLKFEKNKFKVSGDGIFYTIQGEGPTIGMPAVFLRLHICNLQCIWCDAWYTWSKSTSEFWTEANNWTLEETENKLIKAWSFCEDKTLPIRVVITGGEPILQKDLITKLAKRHKDWKWEIETNGTIMPTDYMFKHFRFNCSPKLENSKNIKALRFKKDVLKAINHVEKSCFKFVVMRNSDLDEIEKDFIDTGIIKRSKVILMPQGVTGQEVWSNARKIAEYCKKKGFRLLGRLQCDIWGAKRKV